MDPASETRAAGTDDLETVLGRLVEIVRRQMHLDVAFIPRIDDGAHAGGAASRGEAANPARQMQLSSTLSSLLLPGRGGVALDDDRADTRTRDLSGLTMAGVGAYVGVPVTLSDGRLYGTLHCINQRPSDPVSERDMHFMRVLADMLAVEVEVHENRASADINRRERIEGLLLASDQLAIVYQPIVELATGTIRGYEALSRISLEPRRTPDLWFDDSFLVGLGVDLECLAIRRALDGFDPSSGAYISVNTAPPTAISADLTRAIAHVPPDQLVIEVTEHAPITAQDELTAALDRMRAAGSRLAIDDAGAGFSGLQRILDLKPDIIKLDISLTRGVDIDPIRHSLAIALQSFAREIGAKIVAEGIETASEYKSLMELGVAYGQGYYMARPAPWGMAELNPDLQSAAIRQL